MNREEATATVRATMARLGLAETVLGRTSETLARPKTTSATQPGPSLPVIALEAVDPATPRTDGPSASTPMADFVAGPTLGRGGMGIVWSAEQRSLRREVAVKTTTTRDVDHTAALVREARTMGRLEHPNVVPVHTLGVDGGGAPVLVMKRIEGVVWTALLRDPEHPAWGRLLAGHDDRLRANVEILAQLCRALAFAHSRGVVHRDVKPDNVMIGNFGEVYLLDWGIALELAHRDDEPHGIVGTPGYLAPEMVHGDPRRVDARTDVYLLGATLYEVITGHMPHAADNVMGSLASSLLGEWQALPPETPDDLAELVRASMHVEMDSRLASADAFRDGLARFLASHEAALLVRDARTALQRADDATKVEGPLSADAYRALIEARFALAAAVRMRRDDSAARSTLDGCLTRLVERELALRSPIGARALLAEMTEAPANLASRIAALEADLARERAAAEDQRRRRAEKDLSRIWRFAGAFVLAVCTLLALVSYSVAWANGRSVPPPVARPREVLLVQGVMLPVVALALFVFRRKAFGNVMARQLTALFSVWFWAPLVHAALAQLRGDSFLDPLTDLVTGMAVVIVGVLTLIPELWPAIVSYAAMIAFALAMPRLLGAVTPLFFLVNATLTIRALRLRGQRPGVEAVPPPLAL